MKKISAIMLCLAVVASASTAQAAIKTITFSGADIVALASPVVNTTGIPIIGDGEVTPVGADQIRTYDSVLGVTVGSWSGQGDPAAFNTWLNSLGEGEGVSEFGLWLQNGNSNQAGMWGETLALVDPYSDEIYPFASPGWTASVHTLTVWGPSWEGRKLITYTADAPEYYLRPGMDADFGFTADVFEYANRTGPEHQIWVGANDIHSLDGTTSFQRAVGASVVPEPASIAVWSLLGAVCVAGALRRRNRRVN